MTRALAIFVLVGACSGGDGGGSCPSYMQISGGQFSRTATRLTWTMEVSAPPDTVTFNRTGVPPFVLEYQWAIDIDVDHDDDTDLRASVEHFREMDAAEVMTADILSVTNEGLWSVEGPALDRSGDVFAAISGTTFTFEVEQSEDPALANVTDASQSTWTTFQKFGPKLEDQCGDDYQP